MKQLMRKIIVTGLFAAMLLTAFPTMPILAASEFLGDIRWDFVTDSEGFDAKNGGEIVGVTGGVLQMSTTTNDPNISAYNLRIIPNEHKYLRFRMKNNSRSSIVQAYFFDKENKIFGAQISVEPNSDFTEYQIELSAHEGLMKAPHHPVYTEASEYVTLRLDLLNGVTEGNIELDYVVLSQYEIPPANEVIAGVCLGDDEIEEFKGDGEYCEAEVYADVYNVLNSGDVNVIFAEEYADLEAQVNIKEVTDRKIVDITAVYEDGSGTRSYRIVCKTVKRPTPPTELEIAECEINGNVISFSGSLSVEERRSVTIVAHQKGTEIKTETMKYLGVISPNEIGEFSGEIKIYDPETTPEKYELEVLFDVAGAREPVKRYVTYINNAKRTDSLQQLKNSELGVLEYMIREENQQIYESMGVWPELYNAQPGAVKDKMNQAAEPYRGSLTPENAGEIANGTMLAVLMDGMSGEEAIKLLVRFDEAVKPLEVEGNRFGESEAKAQIWIADNVTEKNPRGFENWEEFCDAVQKSMLLELVNTTTYMKLSDLLLRNTDILGDHLTKLANQKNTDIVDTAMRRVGLQAQLTGFDTVGKLIAAVNQALEDASDEAGGDSTGGTSSGSSGFGGGRGSSGGSSYVTSGSEQTVPLSEPNSISNVPFVDMAGYEWAETAILKLYERGVVNGTGDGRFEPGRPVTREEFVKLMNEAFGFGVGLAETVFADVRVDDWFAKYVSRAVEMDIIKGISEELFGSGTEITREDMAVIIHRAFLSSDRELSFMGEEFTDAQEISEYAREAVHQLAAAEIVNGVGEGRFSPKDSATRAEAAVIIQRCIEKLSMEKGLEYEE